MGVDGMSNADIFDEYFDDEKPKYIIQNCPATERFIMGKGISIDNQIELLENQLSGLKKQKKEEMKRCLFSNIENRIIDAKKRNIEIKAIYVGDETFMMLEIAYLNNCPISPLFCKSPIDFMGYKVYRNSKLDRKEIQVAF